MKQRPNIPPPKMTLPDQQVAPASPAPPASPPPLAVVPPPARMPSMKITTDGIEYTNPTIELRDYVRTGGIDLVKRLTPARAVITHGVLVIEEMRLTLTLDGATIRS